MAHAAQMRSPRSPGFGQRARLLARRFGAALLILSASDLLFGGGAVPQQAGAATARDVPSHAAPGEIEAEPLCRIMRRYGKPLVLEARLHWCPQL